MGEPYSVGKKIFRCGQAMTTRVFPERINSKGLMDQDLKRGKLLFLAYSFPPVRTIATIRAGNIAKYLTRLGWEVTVVTTDPSVWQGVEDGEKASMELDREGIRRILTGHRWRCLDPIRLKCWNQNLGWFAGGVCRIIRRRLGIETDVGWIKAAEQACSTLSPKDVDIILTTGPPFGIFRLARCLSDKWGCPYVLDYRDPWENPGEGRYAERVIRTTEEALIQGSAAVVSISESLLGGGALGSKLHVITNGFDPEEMEQIKPYNFGHFAIVYAGAFYSPQRTITPVMQALKSVRGSRIDQSIPWKFHYYGPHNEHVRAEAQRFGVLDRVELHGLVPRSEALAAIRGAGLTVVITSVLEETADPNEAITNGKLHDKAIVTGKLFDALGLGAPTLIVGPRGADVDAVIQTTGLAHIIPARNINGIALFLEKAMSGQTPPPMNPHAYAWPNLIKKLDVILSKSIESNPRKLSGATTHEEHTRR
jgi:glycosyltransferase involved in cell wall biosynthesis